MKNIKFLVQRIENLAVENNRNKMRCIDLRQMKDDLEKECQTLHDQIKKMAQYQSDQEYQLNAKINEKQLKIESLEKQLDELVTPFDLKHKIEGLEASKSLLKNERDELAKQIDLFYCLFFNRDKSLDECKDILEKQNWAFAIPDEEPAQILKAAFLLIDRLSEETTDLHRQINDLLNEAAKQS